MREVGVGGDFNLIKMHAISSYFFKEVCELSALLFAML